jgi:hypothetical protein
MRRLAKSLNLNRFRGFESHSYFQIQEFIMKQYKRLDSVMHRLDQELKPGHVYRLGIVHCGYLFSHYMDVRVISMEIHNEYSTSYFCSTAEKTGGYFWDKPGFGSTSTRIVSAELLGESFTCPQYLKKLLTDSLLKK